MAPENPENRLGNRSIRGIKKQKTAGCDSSGLSFSERFQLSLWLFQVVICWAT